MAVFLLLNVIRFLQTVIFVRVLLTWIMPGPLPGPLQKIAAPIDRLLGIFRVLIPAGGAFIDIGPMLCLILLEVIQRVLIGAFYTVSYGAF